MCQLLLQLRVITFLEEDYSLLIIKNKINSPKLKKTMRNVLKSFLAFIILFTTCTSTLAQTATIYGTVLDSTGSAASDVTIFIDKTQLIASSNDFGYYQIKVPANKALTLVFTYLSTSPRKISIPALQPDIKLKVDVVISYKFQITDVTIEAQNNRNKPSIITVDPKLLKNIPGTGQFEAVLKLLPGVTTNNELSSSYNVRGGNFDENLVYVNDIEIYRPMLLSSGQQEGLSFINADLVKNITFSAGGFEAKYGDKLASVLDIQYNEPKALKSTISAGLLGAQLHNEGISKHERFTWLVGYRLRNNQLLLNSLETKGEYQTRFQDFQSLLTFKINPRWNLSWLTYAASNNYLSLPQDRQTKFGTVKNAKQLSVSYEGRNILRYQSMLNGLNITYNANEKLRLKLIGSSYISMEDELADIDAVYNLDQLENDFGKPDFGKVKYNLGYGRYFNHIRNYMNINVLNVSHLGSYVGDYNYINWGIKWQQEHINDALSEWKFNDSSNYFVPYIPNDIDNTFPLSYRLRTELELASQRYSGFIQNTEHFKRNGDITLTYGARATYWSYNKETDISPRFQVSWLPNKKYNALHMNDTNANLKRDIILKAAVGVYYQPPFYRELRNNNGILNPNIKSQKSTHFVLGGDMNLKIWDRPFKIFSEIYYKQLKDLIPYEIDDVRIRYLADKTSNGYASGLDFRINGEFIKHEESWFSLSYLNTRENILGDTYVDVQGNTKEIGYLRRPTDQRITAAIYFQDALPSFPKNKMYLNLLFGTGMPTSPPGNPQLRNTFTVPQYKRVDIGFARVIFDDDTKGKGKISSKIKELKLSLEIFNLLNINNTLSYLWVQDLTGTTYAVPNYLTARKLNLRVYMRF